MRGAALANHVALVDALIDKGASKNDAVRGAAECNHQDEVNAIVQGASKNWAVKGAADNNHGELVAKLGE